MCEWQPRCIYRVPPGSEERAFSLRRDEEFLKMEQLLLRVLNRFPEAKRAVVEEIERVDPMDSG
jgi:hypothetical protein